MKTILRKAKLKLFFQGPDQWTGDPRKAFNFKSIDRAQSFIQKWHLRDVEVAFAFGDRDDVTAVPAERMSLHYD